MIFNAHHPDIMLIVPEQAVGLGPNVSRCFGTLYSKLNVVLFHDVEYRGFVVYLDIPIEILRDAARTGQEYVEMQGRWRLELGDVRYFTATFYMDTFRVDCINEDHPDFFLSFHLPFSLLNAAAE
jgi:hypothetical protein